MKKYLLLLFIFSMFHLNAQEMEIQVIASAGTNMESGDLSLVWTLGEMATETHQGNFFDLFVGQGFHQESIMLVNTVDLDSGLQFDVFPNPAVETVFISSDAKELLNLAVVDLMGRTLSSQPLSFPIEKTAVDVSQLPAAPYFLQVSDENGNLVHIFKIQKLNQ